MIMTKRSMYLCFLLAAVPLFAAPATSDATRRIQDRFVAPCCWQENLAFHRSPVADEMRAEVSQLVNSGKSENEIVEFYVARYGERILREPRGNLGLWLKVTPFAIVTLAAAMLAWFIWRLTSKSKVVNPVARGLAPDDDFDW
jgi:cytochrome c-type biogenesis protein CcmH